MNKVVDMLKDSSNQKLISLTKEQIKDSKSCFSLE